MAGLQHVLKDVVQPPCHPLKVSRLQGLHQTLGVGAAGDLFHIHPAKQLGGGDGEGGLAHHDIAGGQGGDGSDPLASALHQGGAPYHAVGHVGTHGGSNVRQLQGGQIGVIHLIHGPQHGGGIRAAPRHARTHGDVLVNVDVQHLPLPGGRAEGGGGLLGQVAAVGGEKGQVGGHAPLTRGEGEGVGEVDGHHHHLQVVEAIFPAAENVQGQIQLGIGLFLHVHPPASVHGGLNGLQQLVVLLQGGHLRVFGLDGGGALEEEPGLAGPDHP